jgi:hypothetical protein
MTNYFFALGLKPSPQYVKGCWHRLSSPTGRMGQERCDL